MANIKMDNYVQIKLTPKSKYSSNNNVVTAGIRNGSFFLNGKINAVIFVEDIECVFVIKDGIYQGITIDTFLKVYKK